MVDDADPQLAPGRGTNLGDQISGGWDGAPYATQTIAGDRLPWASPPNQHVGPGMSGPLHAPITGPSPQPASERAALTPLADGPHESFKAKVEFGSGSITGAITGTFELGEVGFGADEMSVLKNSASLKINGWARKFETTLMSGKFDGELFEGVKVAFDWSAMKMTAEKDAKPDLMSVGVRVSGDVSRWLQAPRGVKLTIDGSLKFALGGKLLAELASYVAAKAEQQQLTIEIQAATEAITAEKRAIEALEAAAKAGKATEGAVAKQLLRHRASVASQVTKLKTLVPRLKEVTGKVGGVMKALRSKIAGRVARVMEKQTVKFISKALGKLVPVLNWLLIANDVIELAGLVIALIRNKFHDGDGDGDGDGEHDAEESNGPGGDGSNDAIYESPEVQQAERMAAINELHPAARKIFNRVCVADNAAGPTLTAAQIRTLGMLIPKLSAKDTETIVERLRDNMYKVQTAEDVIVAVDQAVREIRDRNSTVTVDGTARPDLVPQNTGKAVTSPRDVEGPISSPEQVGGSGPEQPALSEEMAVVRTGSEDEIGKWFYARGSELVLSNIGEHWKETYVGLEIAPRVQLQRVRHSIADAGDGAWRVEVSFAVTDDGTPKTYQHVYRVTRGRSSGAGAQVGELVIEKLHKLQVQIVDESGRVLY